MHVCDNKALKSKFLRSPILKQLQIVIVIRITLYSSEESYGAKDDSFLRESSNMSTAATIDGPKALKQSSTLSSSNPDLLAVGSSSKQDAHATGDLHLDQPIAYTAFSSFLLFTSRTLVPLF